MSIQINGLNILQNNDINSSRNNKTNGVEFGNYLKNAINNVNKLQLEAEHQSNLLALGEVDSVHQVVIASEKANVALQLTLQIRNKVLDAYNEIMRMQV